MGALTSSPPTTTTIILNNSVLWCDVCAVFDRPFSCSSSSSSCHHYSLIIVMSDIMCVCVAIVSGFSIIYLNGMSSLSEMYLHFNCVLAFNVCVCHFNLCFIHSEAIVWYIICLWASHIFLSLCVCVCVCVCQIRADNLYMFSHLYARVAR